MPQVASRICRNSLLQSVCMTENQRRPADCVVLAGHEGICRLRGEKQLIWTSERASSA
ncbi:hypothetical protein ALP99_101036 [Pseudomonas syringae pv. tomato]|uniref:Uncharacterized protein n=1 Tax=Pseudomonas syringae pv. maculicola TaxID=59511 RepID=A0A3M6CDY5_PSEYM|nr:hypothetical protein ALO87_101007 [Pseudomonas syringae pv. apii]RMM04497.1 hypothetical protein ALQ85_100987 [Pseudomonas syringae]RMQ69882.1 hypothetical protein ALP99_101036 [Pseudomonas syringae pv. tomato]RMR26779.1 hypothetical protein ALP89_100976 [Pseudomonas syringae pv. persicae]RMT37202.1 hypothetical protein ALP50_101243 [Pseudomonas syringae pv. spinaceae]RMV41947.1 hypothetical protein ALP13_101487 [Pseudomonas syringae pv. maculicola]